MAQTISVISSCTVYQEIFGHGREEERQRSPGIERGPSRVGRPPICGDDLVPPAAVDAYETFNNHTGFGFVCFVVFGFDLWILVAGEGWGFASALALDVCIVRPTAGVGIRTIPENPIVRRRAVHTENLVIKNGQCNPLRRLRSGISRLARNSFFRVTPFVAIIEAIPYFLVFVATMDHKQPALVGDKGGGV